MSRIPLGTGIILPFDDWDYQIITAEKYEKIKPNIPYYVQKIIYKGDYYSIGEYIVERAIDDLKIFGELG